MFLALECVLPGFRLWFWSAGGWFLKTQKLLCWVPNHIDVSRKEKSFVDLTSRRQINQRGKAVQEDDPGKATHW